MSTAGPTVVNLLHGAPVDLKHHLAGGWRSVQVFRVPAGSRMPLAAEGVEHALYVVEGEGNAQVGSRGIDLRPGVALTFPRGSAADLHAAGKELELFVVTLDA